LNQRQNTARGQVERLHKRNELVARIDTLKIRIPIAKYAAARQTHMEIRNKRNEVRQRAQELQDTHLPLKQQTDNYKHRKDFAKRDVERKKKAVDDRIKKIKSCENKTKEFDDVANNINGEIQRIRKAKQQKKLRLDALRKEIPKLENAVVQCQKKVDELSPNWKEDLEVHRS
jgi:chromosome segregation ATPase